MFKVLPTEAYFASGSGGLPKRVAIVTSSFNSNDRMEYLDGLRGVAAVSVVVFHLASAFWPNLTTDYGAEPFLIVWTPLKVFWNGHFAVLIFFTLSGMIVTEAVHRRSQPLWSRLLLRYLRLAVPAGFSVLVAWGLLTLFPTAATDLQEHTGSMWLTYTHQGDIPNLPAALYDGFISVFLWGGSSFNNALWTMRPELLGSAFCFVIALFPDARLRVAGALAVGVLVVSLDRPEYLCFTLGILLAEARAARRLHGLNPLGMLILGLVIGSQAGAGAGAFGGLIGQAAGYHFVHPIASAAVVYGSIYCLPVQRQLSRPLPQLLGVVAVPLYLLHVPLIKTVLAQAYLVASGNVALFAIALLLWLIGLFGASYFASEFVEKPLLVFLGRLRKSLDTLGATPVIGSKK